MNNSPFSDNIQTNEAQCHFKVDHFSFSMIMQLILWLFISSLCFNAQAISAPTTPSNLTTPPTPTTPSIPSIPTIVIFYQHEGEQQTKLIQTLQTQLKNDLPNIQLNSVDIKQLNKSKLKTYLDTKPLCAVSIGEDATKKILSLRSTTKTFALNISQNELKKLNRVYKRLNIEVTGIFHEQSFKRQLLLAKAIQPELKKVSVLVGQVDKFDLAKFEQISKKNELSLDFRILQRADTAENFVTKIAGRNDFVLMLNNKQIYTRAKLASLILKATRHKIRLIGNLIDSAKIGMLASVYTPQSSLVIESSNDIKSYCQMNKNIEPHFARDFKVSINHKIAKTLNLNTLQNNMLEQTISTLEKDSNKNDTLKNTQIVNKDNNNE